MHAWKNDWMKTKATLGQISACLSLTSVKFHDPWSCREQQRQASEGCVCSSAGAKPQPLESMRATVQLMGGHAKAQPQLHSDL